MASGQAQTDGCTEQQQTQKMQGLQTGNQKQDKTKASTSEVSFSAALVLTVTQADQRKRFLLSDSDRETKVVSKCSHIREKN